MNSYPNRFIKGQVPWNKKEPVTKVCPCGKDFSVPPYRAETAQFCSQSCVNKGRSSWNRNTKGIMKPNATSFTKGQVAWNAGTHGVVKANSGSFKKGNKPWCMDTKGVVVAWNKGKPYLAIQDEKHSLWKGEYASYTAKHTWISRKLGKPLACSDCGKTGGTTRNYHWSNISGDYLRDVTDWERLCVSCHKYKDLARIATKKGILHV